MDLVVYFGKVNLYWVLFYILYCLMLRNHTFFRWNRAYLTGTLVLAFLLPFITFPEQVPIVPAAAQEVSFLPAYNASSEVKQGLDQWMQFVFAVQIIGSLLLLFKLFEGIKDLVMLIRRGEAIEMGDFTLVLLPNNEIGSFSFLKWLVVNRTDYEQHFEPILVHESVHIRQFHTLDILFIELLKIPFWFNPALWLYKKSIQEIHEFLADEEVPNRDYYARFLVAYSLSAPIATLTNHFFNSSLLKSRIKMIYKNRDSKWRLTKYFMILPIIGVVVVLTAARTSVMDSVTQQYTRATVPDKTSSNAKAKSVNKFFKTEDRVVSSKTSPKTDSLPANKPRDIKPTLVAKIPSDETLSQPIPGVRIRGTGELNLTNHFSTEGMPIPGERINIDTPRTFAAEPLIFIDGVEQELRGTAGFSHINENDIKFISVLKGRAAIAAYGDEGRNGVILILMKGN